MRAQRNESIFCLGNSGTTSRRYHLQDGSPRGRIFAVCPEYSFRFHSSSLLIFFHNQHIYLILNNLQTDSYAPQNFRLKGHIQKFKTSFEMKKSFKPNLHNILYNLYLFQTSSCCLPYSQTTFQSLASHMESMLPECSSPASQAPMYRLIRVCPSLPSSPVKGLSPLPPSQALCFIL